MVFDPISRDQRADDCCTSNPLNLARRDVVVAVVVMRFMAAFALEPVLQSMGHQVETSKEKENGHGEASDNLGALEAKGMTNAAAAPDLKVAQYIDGNADEGTASIEEDKMGERHDAQRTFGLEEEEGGHGMMTE